MSFLTQAHEDADNPSAIGIILLTDNLADAVKAARRAEELGYHLLGARASVTITRICVGHTYRKGDFENNTMSAPKGHPAIYIRQMISGAWIETWLQAPFKKEFEKESNPPAPGTEVEAA